MASRIQMKTAPQLKFVHDRLTAIQAHAAQLLQDIQHEGAASHMPSTPSGDVVAAAIDRLANKFGRDQS
eukprot:CAMPEP_0202917050 /NCGR_PEP_ID=MMETSP1392-20130828/70104_1 /ASSEMBLY_ACC=CAM_ASM_000868 /TAXON_ID=225041 /ORGANISM="Chlamydomonas chlamydogama, Strain SAG 11-48b" /LENGTH=68 /DNA_ID=CAMNT_0049609667 /DNA_START=472 /DNA_END=678 /DNA_ORIENTATION=+